MTMSTTTLKIDSEINKDLSIVSTLLNKTKQELAEKFIRDGLQPYLKGIVRQRFS